MLGFYRYDNYNVKTVPFPKKPAPATGMVTLLQCTYAESASPSTASAERLLLPFRYKIAFLINVWEKSNEKIVGFSCLNVA